jgi:hypothetical protein
VRAAPPAQPTSAHLDYRKSLDPANPGHAVPLPNWIEFSDATVIASVVGNIQTADQLSAIKIRVQSWHEND